MARTKTAPSNATTTDAASAAPVRAKRSRATKPRPTDQAAPVLPAAIPVAAKVDLHPVPKAAEPTHEQIARRAYQVYLTRNGAPGDARSDWAQAERELREQLRRQ